MYWLQYRIQQCVNKNIDVWGAGCWGKAEYAIPNLVLTSMPWSKTERTSIQVSKPPWLTGALEQEAAVAMWVLGGLALYRFVRRATKPQLCHSEALAWFSQLAVGPCANRYCSERAGFQLARAQSSPAFWWKKCSSSCMPLCEPDSARVLSSSVGLVLSLKLWQTSDWRYMCQS